jgi:hypothetical protein
MKAMIMGALMIAASAGLAMAAEDNNVTGKAAQDNPGTTSGGSTATPNAKPDSSSLSAKQMQTQPGANGASSGTTSTPNAKPADSSLSGQEMKQNPGATK